MYRFALWGTHVRERGGAHKCPVCLSIKIDSVHNLWFFFRRLNHSEGIFCFS